MQSRLHKQFMFVGNERELYQQYHHLWKVEQLVITQEFQMLVTYLHLWKESESQEISCYLGWVDPLAYKDIVRFSEVHKFTHIWRMSETFN